MAIGDYQLSIRTYEADDIINECLGPPPTSLPELKYYVPAYDPSVLIYDGDKLLGVTSPVATTSTIENQLEYDVAGTPTKFRGNLKSGHVTRMPFDGVNPPRLKIRITKNINEDNIGGQANVFYICDDQMRIWVVIHVSPHVFAEGQKWEIVTDLVVADSKQIIDFVEDLSLFEYKTASEILLPGIIVGNNGALADGKATHTISEFQNVDFQSDDFNLNKRIIFLKDVDALTANITISGGNMDFSMETPEAVLPLANHTLTLNGDNISGQLRVSGLVNNGLVLNGSNLFLNIISDNNDGLDLTNANGFVVHNGKVTSTSAEFTGPATVPTANDGDASKLIANTEFVKKQLAYYDVMRLKGAINASTSPNYPAANAGDFYVISVAGKIGGASGPSVEVQDTMLCIADEVAEGDHASVGSNWILGQVNTDMDLEGAIRDHLATNKIVRLKGSINTDTYPNYPAADAGDMYVINNPGKIGGSSGPNVERNDTIMCLTDGTLAGDHATVGPDWMIGQVNTDLELGTALSSYLKVYKEHGHGWTEADIGKMVIKEVGGGEGAFLTANADNPNTAEVVGHISYIDSTDQFTINRIGHLKRTPDQWDALCGTTGGLTEGDVYFLNTSGGSFYTKDTSHFIEGNVDMPAFIALSATDVWYYGYRGSEVGGNTSKGTFFTATNFTNNTFAFVHGLDNKYPSFQMFDQNGQPVNNIARQPTAGNENNSQDVWLSNEMLAAVGSHTWYLRFGGDGTNANVDISSATPFKAEGNGDPGTSGFYADGEHTHPADVGQIAYFPRTTAPDGWLILDGSSNIEKALFPALWSFAQAAISEGVIGFADIDGIYFKIPDLRGVFIRSLDSGKGLDTDSARVIGSYQADANKYHRHSAYTNSANGWLPYNSLGARDFHAGCNQGIVMSKTAYTYYEGVDSDGRPKNIALLPCIKY